MKITALEIVKGISPMMYCYSGSGMLSNDCSDEVAVSNAKASAVFIINSLLRRDITIEQLEELRREILNIPPNINLNVNLFEEYYETESRED